MIKLQVSTQYHIHSENRLLQGDILKDISYFIGDLDDTKSAESVSIPFE